MVVVTCNMSVNVCGGFVMCGCFDIYGVFGNTCTYLLRFCIVSFLYNYSYSLQCKDYCNRVKSQVKQIVIITIITKKFVVIFCRRFERKPKPIFKCTDQFSRVKYMDFLTFEGRQFWMSRNFGKKLPLRSFYRPQHRA